MKRCVITVVILITIFFNRVNAQLDETSCNEFPKFTTLAAQQNAWKTRDLAEFDVAAYGATRQEAILKAKAQALRILTFRDQYLRNPIVDSILDKAAGIVINVSADNMRIRKRKGQYQCNLYEVKYNPKAVEKLKKQVQDFIGYSVVFDISPYVRFYGEQATKEIYREVADRMHTAMMASKYQFNNVINYKQLKLTLPPKGSDSYCSCTDGYHYYRTGSKYVDYIEALRHSASNIDVDVAIVIDTITIAYNNADNRMTVNFSLLGFNIKTGRELLKYRVEYQTDIKREQQAVSEALQNNVITKEVDNYMNQLVSRYGSYVLYGVPFELRICSNLFPSDMYYYKFLKLLKNCPAFENIKTTDWIYLKDGSKIGTTFSGMTFAFDQIDQILLVHELLQKVGLKEDTYEIHTVGSRIIVTPKTKTKNKKL